MRSDMSLNIRTLYPVRELLYLVAGDGGRKSISDRNVAARRFLSSEANSISFGFQWLSDQSFSISN